ncbi:hypothetical protein BpHYR1_050114 [Brachionus plicatilis]|uniref:Uncharacterized protein n=1 Tax=Brachionus plicatilis TaxID=10195 RepID=A0A3M7RDE7_BRAPC|nr:hypothetical protein BpHYR1_050114 [Brachionus plicatilis]
MILLISLITHQILKLINARLNRMKRAPSFHEPEVLMFNESFDAIQLNLRRKSISSLQQDDLYTSFEMLKNLNKLYDNVQYESESVALDSMEMDDQQELMEVSDYMDDSIFSTTLFDRLTSTDQSLEHTALTNSDSKAFAWQDANLCQSLGRYAHSTLSISSMSSTPSSVNTRIKSYRVLKNSLLFQSGHSRSKKLRSRTQRLRQTHNFYRRHQRTSSLNVPVPNGAKNFLTKKYRPSFKVEKLLNDSRGMKKYLVDYDGLISHKSQRQHHITTALNNLNSLLSTSSNSMTSIDLDLTNDNQLWCSELRGPLVFEDSLEEKENLFGGNVPSSNRCSSGYLSDC